MNDKKLEIIAEPGKPSFTTRRVVNAPRSLVFDAFVRPELIKRWMGPRSLTMPICDIDFRVGGTYRFVHETPDGQQFAFSGRFIEIVRPEKIVRTFVFEPMPDAEALETVELEERGGKTTIKTLTVHKSVEARDGHIGSGMEGGMVEGYARLDELIASLVDGGGAQAGR